MTTDKKTASRQEAVAQWRRRKRLTVSRLAQLSGPRQLTLFLASSAAVICRICHSELPPGATICHECGWIQGPIFGGDT